MSTFSLRIDGLDQLKANIAKGGAEVKREVKKAMSESTSNVMIKARELAHHKTGNLQRSIQNRVENDGLTGIVYQDTDMASYGPGLEFGTSPHDIVPVRKMVLADRKAGIIFGKLVHHPGNKPYPFMAPALKNKKEFIKTRFHQATDNIVKIMANKSI